MQHFSFEHLFPQSLISCFESFTKAQVGPLSYGLPFVMLPPLTNSIHSLATAVLLLLSLTTELELRNVSWQASVFPFQLFVIFPVRLLCTFDCKWCCMLEFGWRREWERESDEAGMGRSGERRTFRAQLCTRQYRVLSYMSPSKYSLCFSAPL